MPFEITIPFNVGEDGQIDTISGPDDQVRQHVLALINTEFSERVMLPTYGIDANSLIFENLAPSQITLLVSNQVSSAFNTWEPGVSLISIIPNDTSGSDVSQIDVLYKRLDAPDSMQSANVNTAIIGADGTVKDVIRG